MLITPFLLALGGCGSPPPDPAGSPQAKLCGRAYGSTVDSLQDYATQNGVAMPEVALKQDYVQRCVELDFTEAQLRCLDPKLAAGDADCAAAIAEIGPRRDQLSDLLMKRGAAPAAPVTP